MFGLDNKSGINVMPPIAPADSQSPLWFTEGGAGLSATYPGQDWFNQIQAELLNVLKEAGLTADKSKLNQLALAIKAIVGKSAVTIVNSPGTSTTSVMSQKAVTDLAETKQPKGDYQPAGNYYRFSEINEMPGRGFNGVFSGGVGVKYIKGISVSSGGQADTGQIFVDFNAVVTARYLNSNGSIRENRIVGVPIGATIEWQSSASIPEGFLENDGRSFSASDHPELAKIFPGLKLPDDRGLFKRGLDRGKNIDPGRTLGSVQGDAMRNLTGRFGNPTIEGGDFSEGVFRHSVNSGGRAAGAGGNSIAYSFDASRQVSTANEFRPVNKSVIYITRVI
ncbi:tail fiber protein [Morganella morganii]|nr:tail fiber protein [Morganella morganii]